MFHLKKWVAKFLLGKDTLEIRITIINDVVMILIITLRFREVCSHTYSDLDYCLVFFSTDRW